MTAGHTQKVIGKLHSDSRAATKTLAEVCDANFQALGQNVNKLAKSVVSLAELIRDHEKRIKALESDEGAESE